MLPIACHVHIHSPRVFVSLIFMCVLIVLNQRFQRHLVGLDALVFCSLQQALQWCTRSYYTILRAMAKDSGEHGHELGNPAWPIAEVFINIFMGNFM